MMGFGSGLGMTGFGLGFGGLGGLLVLVLLVVGGVYLFRALDHKAATRNHTQRTAEDGALQLLRERYARGEIDHDEYQRRKEDLRAE